MKYKIVDTTLRDGEQTAGISFSNEEKINIVRFLDRLGVDIIEVGIPAMGSVEQQAIQRILNLNLKASIVTWNRAKISDIQKSIECGSRFIHISLPVSDVQIRDKLKKTHEWVIEELKRSCDYLNREGLTFSVGAEDASRSDFDFLVRYSGIACDFGASRLRYCDTVGILDPFSLFEKIEALKKHTKLPLEIHTHNDLGMATANTLAGVRAGAEYISTTFLGIGERAGNAAMEEVVMALKYSMGIKLNINTELFTEFSKYLSKVTGRPLISWKPIVGSLAFAHESGIHVDAILKNPVNYEPFPPEEVGNSRKLIIGKHSGKHAIKERFKELGIFLDEAESTIILQEVRKSSQALKGMVPDSEMMRIYQNLIKVNG